MKIDFIKQIKDAQDAHEAIRPAHIEISPDEIKEYLTSDQYKLYKLIYNRFLASQMAAAIFRYSTSRYRCKSK